MDGMGFELVFASKRLKAFISSMHLPLDTIARFVAMLEERWTKGSKQSADALRILLNSEIVYASELDVYHIRTGQ